MKQWEHRQEHKEQNGTGVQTQKTQETQTNQQLRGKQASIHRSDQEKQTVTGSVN